MLLADLVMALVGLLVFPLVIVANIVFQRLQSPLMTRAQALRAEVSEVAHESFDGAMVVKTLGRESEETDRFAEQGPPAARRRHPRRPGPGGVRPGARGAAQPRRARRARRRRAAGAERRRPMPATWSRSAYLLTIVAFPIRSLGWLLGEFPRSVVGFERVGAVLAATGGDAVRRAGDRRRRATAPGSTYATSPTATTPTSACSTDLTFTVEPGRTVAVVGATASGKSTLTSLLVRLVDPDDGAVLLDGTDLRDLAAGALAEHVALVPQHAFLFDDTVRGNVTLGADVDRRARSGRRCGPRRPTGSSPGCRRPRQPAGGARHHAVRRPAAAALAGPGAGTPAPAAGDGRRHLGGRPGGRGADPRRAARLGGDSTMLVVAYRKATIGAGRRGALPRRRARRRPGHPHRAARRAARRTPTWSTPTSRTAPRRATTKER